MMRFFKIAMWTFGTLAVVGCLGFAAMVAVVFVDARSNPPQRPAMSTQPVFADAGPDVAPAPTASELRRGNRAEARRRYRAECAWFRRLEPWQRTESYRRRRARDQHRMLGAASPGVRRIGLQNGIREAVCVSLRDGYLPEGY